MKMIRGMLEPEVQLRRLLRASPERVFAAFAKPELVSAWLRPSPDIGLDVLEMDFRVGGAWRFAYHVPNAPIVVICGEYRVIEPPSKLVYSWIIEPPDEHAGLRSEVTVTLTPAADGTELNISHHRLTLPGSPERHAQGWEGALDLLAKLLNA
jgi:uncharacterized protein YndB with AHSA1/START domain